MRNDHEAVMDDLDALVAGDPDAIARHAEHLAGCDECRDARHDATMLAHRLRDAGADHVAPRDVVERLMASLDATATATATTSSVAAAGAAAGTGTGTGTGAGAVCKREHRWHF